MEPSKLLNQECAHCGSPRKVVNPRWLRHVREQAGQTQRQVADALGFSVPYICDIEAGRRACSPKILAAYERIAR